MQSTMDAVTTAAPVVSEAEAQEAAAVYVAAHVDPSFTVASGAQINSKTSDRKFWQFMLSSH